MITAFDESVDRLAILVTQSEGTTLVFAVSNDRALRDRAMRQLTDRLSGDLAVSRFDFDATHLSILEGGLERSRGETGSVMYVSGLEQLTKDKRAEAIQLLNLQRNRVGRTNFKIVLWTNRLVLDEIATRAPDFYSWRSAVIEIEAPVGWQQRPSQAKAYLKAVVEETEYVNLQGLAPTRGGQIVQMDMDEIFVPLSIEPEIDWEGERRGGPAADSQQPRLTFDSVAEGSSISRAARLLAERGWAPQSSRITISDLLGEHRA